MSDVDPDARERLGAATIRCWDDKPGCNCANQNPRPGGDVVTTDRELTEYVMALPLTPALPLGERREAVRLLLPVVQAMVAEGAARELRAAADGIGDWPGVGNAIRSHLRDRADELDPS